MSQQQQSLSSLIRDGDACCAVCGTSAMARCSRCKSVKNCSGVCQIRDWKHLGHKEECNEIEKDDLARSLRSFFTEKLLAENEQKGSETVTRVFGGVLPSSSINNKVPRDLNKPRLQGSNHQSRSIKTWIAEDLKLSIDKVRAELAEKEELLKKSTEDHQRTLQHLPTLPDRLKGERDDLARSSASLLSRNNKLLAEKKELERSLVRMDQSIWTLITDNEMLKLTNNKVHAELAKKEELLKKSAEDHQRTLQHLKTISDRLKDERDDLARSSASLLSTNNKLLVEKMERERSMVRMEGTLEEAEGRVSQPEQRSTYWELEYFRVVASSDEKLMTTKAQYEKELNDSRNVLFKVGYVECARRANLQEDHPVWNASTIEWPNPTAFIPSLRETPRA